MGDFAHCRLPGVPECQARRSLNVDAQARWACWVPSPRAVPLDSGLWLLEVPLSGLAELPLTAVGEGGRGRAPDWTRRPVRSPSKDPTPTTPHATGGSKPRRKPTARGRGRGRGRLTSAAQWSCRAAESAAESSDLSLLLSRGAPVLESRSPAQRGAAVRSATASQAERSEALPLSALFRPPLCRPSFSWPRATRLSEGEPHGARGADAKHS